MWSDRFIGGLPVRRWLGDQVFRSHLEDGTRIVVRMLERFQVRGRGHTERQQAFGERIRSWRALDTPGVVGLIEGRYDEPTDSYLVISHHVAGTDLGELRRKNRRPFGPSEVVDLLGPALRLVAELHEAGLAHGRLRPSSLVLRRTLEMVEDPFVLVDLDCTERPPPQARSSAFFHPRDASKPMAVDTYGLAAIAWFLTRPTARVPTRPAHRVLEETAPLRTDWESFLREALHPDPSRRLTEVGALADALARFGATSPGQSARAL